MKGLMADRLDDFFGIGAEDDFEATDHVEAELETTTDEISEPVEVETEQTTEAEPEPVEAKVETPKDEASRAEAGLRSAMLAERQRAQAEAQSRQAAEQRASQFEQRVRELEQQQRLANRPDQFEDAEGHEKWLLEQAEKRAEERAEQRFRELEQAKVQAESEKVFRNFEAQAAKHTPEEVEEAMSFAAAKGDNEYSMMGLNQPDPIAFFLEEKNRHAQREEMLRDPDAWALRRAAELSLARASTAPAIQPQHAATAKAPKSIVNARSASAPRSPDEDGDAFDLMFGSKR